MSQQVTQLCNSKTWIEMVKVSKDGVLSLFILAHLKLRIRDIPQRTRVLTALSWAAPPLWPTRYHSCKGHMRSPSRVKEQGAVGIFSAVPSPLPQPGALDPPPSPSLPVRISSLYCPGLSGSHPFLRASINRGSGSMHCNSGKCHLAVGRLRPPGRHTQDVAAPFSPVVFRSPFVHI